MKAHQLMDQVYQDEVRFNQMSLINISEAGRFAADRSIEDYVKRIWHLTKVK
jgi:starch phosphorylase